MNAKKLLALKIAHTVVWAFFVTVIGYIVYAGIVDRIDGTVYAAIGLVVLEGVVLLAFKWRCPLTVWAYRYTDERHPGFDIYLPEWLAKHNKTIFTSIFAAGTVLTVYRLLT
ncbi:hypothetical protein [Gorillibacterium sp. sgz5001074]|uniref:hypothetical protein n=1 Tax=Gorillibacterium sp. sgz5001074 TaxID=3446695 RepID=UPI003F6814DA